MNDVMNLEALFSLIFWLNYKLYLLKFGLFLFSSLLFQFFQLSPLTFIYFQCSFSVQSVFVPLSPTKRCG
jgi:hypothetical protein